MAKRPIKRKSASRRKSAGVLPNPFEEIERHASRMSQGAGSEPAPWDVPANAPAQGGIDPQLLSQAVAQGVAMTLKQMGITPPSSRKPRRTKPELPIERLRQLEQELKQIPVISLDDIPYDRHTEPEKYEAEKERRRRAREEAEALRRQKQAEIAKVRDQLPELLIAQYVEDRPHLKNKTRVVRGMMATVIEDAVKKGFSPEQYVDSESFFSDLDEAVSEVIPAPKPKRKLNGHRDEDWEDFDEDDDEPTAYYDDGAVGSDDDDDDDFDDDDEGRTAGIFGGSESGGKPTRGGPVKENPNEMLDDLKSLQQKLGIY